MIDTRASLPETSTQAIGLGGLPLLILLLHYRQRHSRGNPAPV